MFVFETNRKRLFSISSKTILHGMFHFCLDIEKECLPHEYDDLKVQASVPDMLDVIKNTQNMHIIENVLDYLSVNMLKEYDE